MTIAWYGHLRLKDVPWFAKLTLPAIILFSWGIALLEYIVQIPANRIAFRENGGPFSLWQLKVIQECITLAVFTVFATVLFKNEPLKFNHILSAFFLILAVYFVFKE
jgi:uncharacterized protein (DUF486 family)